MGPETCLLFGLMYPWARKLPLVNFVGSGTQPFSPAHLRTCQKLVKELTDRGITGQRLTRARINLGIFLITKTNGKQRFIWNGKALSAYLKKTDFSYELLQRFLDKIADDSHLGKLDLVDGFFALEVKWFLRPRSETQPTPISRLYTGQRIWSRRLL